jgi:rSAM/selenodomain-associated transferase 2
VPTKILKLLVSIIIPVYRDADALERTLASTCFGTAQVIVASTEPDAASLAGLRAAWPDVVWVQAPLGRAHQMNAGAAVARGAWLVFLHADTHLPPEWMSAIDAADRDSRVAIGCFRFALDSASPAARAIELGVRVRVALFGLPYGDQALFVRRGVFESLGGYKLVPIMEDVDLVRRARGRGELFRSHLPAVTSSRRWERNGWLRLTARHLWLIARYFAGVNPERLVRMDSAGPMKR